MKKTSLTTAVIAGLAGVAGITNMAGAVNLSNDGTGSVLIYPYYTVNGNNVTLLTVVNTTAEGKAVKVRFLEGRDSREVLDFNLYMSPFDTWTAAVYGSGAGAAVKTSDHSCTVPTNAALQAGVPFRNNAFAGTNNDTGPDTLDRTREGYVEMIEMGTVTNIDQGSLDAITHDGSVGGTPKSCAQVVAAWTPGAGDYWVTNSAQDIAAADGGLFGTADIVNAGEGTIAGFSADAVQGFYAPPVSFQHTGPGQTLPNIASATSHVAYTFTFNPVTTTVQPAATTFTTGQDAVSAVFMVDDIYNTYEVDPATGSSTEWVVTFPTKRFYVDPALHPLVVVPPFDELFGESIKGASCDPVGLSYRDREEATVGGSIDFSPPPTVAGTALCWEAQVVTFNQTGTTSAVLGATLVANIPLDTGFVAGWADISFDPGAAGVTFPAHNLVGTGSAGGTTTNTFVGLPATGFDVQNYVNNNVTPGVLANYSGLWSHKYNRVCNPGGVACS